MKAEAETPARPDELEIAAAVAAVVAYMDETDNSRNLHSSHSAGDTEGGGWKLAAYQEAAGGVRSVAPRRQCKLSPWQAAGFFKVCLSLPVACLSLMLAAGAANAQDAPVSLRPLPEDSVTTETVTTIKAPPAVKAQKSYTQAPVINRAQYSRIAPAQGYPFVNGKKSGASQIASPDARASRTAIPFNGPLVGPTTVSRDGWIEDAEDDSFDPSVAPSRRSPQNYTTTTNFTTATPGYDGIPVETRTRTSTSIKSQTVIDPAIQAMVQAANQLNPAFVGKKTVVKIGLTFANSRVDLAAIDGAQVRDAGTGLLVANLTPATRWDVAVQNAGRLSQLAFSKRGNEIQKDRDQSDAPVGTAYGDTRYKNVAFFPGASAASSPGSIKLPLKVGADSMLGQADQSQTSSSGYIISPRAGDPSSVVSVNGKLYRGSIWLKPLPRLVATGQYKAAAFDVINLIDIEDYLLSVVPSEMPSGWPLEALKAQAIAARSYAVANIGKHGKDGYDLKATIDDQVYSGVSTESDNSNVAVAETSNLVLKHEGKAITAFFHSTSGGSTEFSENVWSRPLAYLKSVPDFDDASPHFSWTRRISIDDLEKAVAGDIGHLLSMSVVARTGSNRAQSVLVQGTNGSKTVTGESLRKIFKLPSTLFNVGSETNTYIFAGRGYGHGLGMSQYGAKALAERGCNAAQILSYYYKDVTVDNATKAPSI